MPVSVTEKRSIGMPFSSTLPASMVTKPEAVNLTALPARLVRIWRSRVGSPRKQPRASASTMPPKRSPLSRACGARRSTTLSTTCSRSKSMLSMSSRPASSFEMSRMSLMMVRSASANSRTASAWERCSGESSVSSSRLFMPRMPFIGVLISWLMLARKVDFASLAASAAAFAASRSRVRSSSAVVCVSSAARVSSSSCWRCFCSVMSVRTPTRAPSEVRRLLPSIQRPSPSRRSNTPPESTTFRWASTKASGSLAAAGPYCPSRAVAITRSRSLMPGVSSGTLIGYIVR